MGCAVSCPCGVCSKFPMRQMYYCSGTWTTHAHTHTHTHTHTRCTHNPTQRLQRLLQHGCMRPLLCSFDYDSPYIVALGYGRIIAGMDRGLQGTCLWERRRITIPPHLGYGDSGVGVIIPPNATLVFYIRMIKIERVSLGEGHVLGAGSVMQSEWGCLCVCGRKLRTIRVLSAITMATPAVTIAIQLPNCAGPLTELSSI